MTTALTMWTDRFQALCGEFLNNAESVRYLRLGQAAFNLLYDMHPEIANEIRGTADDPFYVDGLLPEFLAVVALRLTDAA